MPHKSRFLISCPAAALMDVASSLATKAMLEQSNNFIAALVASASNALAGHLEAAKRATELVLKRPAIFGSRTSSTACRKDSPRC